MSAPPDILLGPVLGYEWDAISHQAYYTVLVRTGKGAAPVWEADGQSLPMKALSPALEDGGHIWRAEMPLAPCAEPKSRKVKYAVKRGGMALKNICGDASWTFFLPGKDTAPRLAFCSCNGFSDPNAVRDLNPLAMWERLEGLHNKEEPFSLLLMGGDQLYCDDLARREGAFAKLWTWLDPRKRKAVKVPSSKEFETAYLDHYLLAWCRLPHDRGVEPHTPMVRMMASIPSVMVWDDHDIFDGWGSYQAEGGKQPYYTEAFAAARKAFELYQVRGAGANRSLLDRKPSGPSHYSQGLTFGPFDVLVMDNRSHRTPQQIMDERQWKQTINWLAARVPKASEEAKTLLVVTPVPVVYRRFQDWPAGLPGEHGMEDDLRDHWSHRLHEGERDRLIARLFAVLRKDAAADGYSRITLLSGDVHVGALGFLERTDGSGLEIAQVISSGILHPAPGAVAWAGILALSSDEHFSIKGQPVTAKMVRPGGAEDRYLRRRNFAWLKPGTDGRLWVNWECEVLRDGDPERAEFGLKQAGAALHDL